MWAYQKGWGTVNYTEPLHVVVCDDNEIDAELLLEALQEHEVGGTHRWVDSGAELLDYLRDPSTPRPCLVLLDLRMPGLDGLDVLRVIRSDKNLRGIVVYVYSTSGEPIDVETAYDTGVQGYLIKPNSDDELAQRLATLDMALREFVLPHPPRA